MGCVAVSGQVAEDGDSSGSQGGRGRKGRAFQRRYFILYIYSSLQKGGRAHGVIVITVHLWSGGHCGVQVVTVGWHLAHHVVVVALHFAD